MWIICLKCVDYHRMRYFLKKLLSSSPLPYFLKILSFWDFIELFLFLSSYTRWRIEIARPALASGASVKTGETFDFFLMDSLSSQWVGPYACRSTHSLDVLSSEWASFPFARFFGEYMGQAHSLENLSSERARPILAFGPSSERFRTYANIILTCM